MFFNFLIKTTAINYILERYLNSNCSQNTIHITDYL
jgi:hypothetical protein